MAEFLTQDQLTEKWSPILEHAEIEPITNQHRKNVTAIVLENTERALREERQALMETAPMSQTGSVANYDPVLIGMVRRAIPQMIAYDICGVQPMTAPSGLVFALKSKYVNDTYANKANWPEAQFNEANSAFSGAGSQAGSSPVESVNGLLGHADNPWDANAGFAAGTGMATATAEGATPAEMSFSIDKFTVTAKSRALRAEYSVELSQDLKAVHGLDAESELSNILSNEILAEINREVVRTIYTISKPGCELTASKGTFDLDVDANGRWSVERFKGLLFQIDREANRIAQTTRRGRGNFIICSADVASALNMSGKLDYAPALSTNLNVDESSTTFAGVLSGRYKVYIDPYMANGTTDQFCLVGYKGSSPWDAGLFYCPYVPLQLMRAVDPATFQPKIGFKTRYGLVSHPLSGDAATLGANSNYYFRSFRVANLA